MIRSGEAMNKFARLPADYRNLLVGLAALLVILLLWGAQAAVRSHAPQAQAQAAQVQAQSAEQAARAEAERVTVLVARNTARARWQARVEAARALAQMAGYAMLGALALCVGVTVGLLLLCSVVQRARAAVQLPPVRRLPRGALQFPGGAVLDTQTGAQWQVGAVHDPQLAQALALAAILQARHGLPRREALPLAWREVQALTMEE